MIPVPVAITFIICVTVLAICIINRQKGGK